MSTSATQMIINYLQWNHQVIHMQLKDITHAESLLQPPFRGNCMNFDVGHILCSYDNFLQKLGMPSICNEDEAKVYGSGVEPLTDATKASDLNNLLKRLDESLEKIVDRLSNISEAELEREINFFGETWPMTKFIYFMLWHIFYHSGQLELLRQLAGKNDKVM